MLEPLHLKLDFVPETFSIFLIQEFASKLLPSKPRKRGPAFCVFTSFGPLLWRLLLGR